MEHSSLFAFDGVAVIVEDTATYSYAELRELVEQRAARWRDYLETLESPKFMLHKATVWIDEATAFEQIVAVFTAKVLGLIGILSDELGSEGAHFRCSEGALHRLSADSPSRYGEDVGMLFATSGTTEIARIVGHRWQALLLCASEMAQVLGMDSQTRSLLVLPLQFHYGFSVVTSTLISGGTLIIPKVSPQSAGFLLEIAACIQQLKPTSIASVPRMWALLTRIIPDQAWATLRQVVFAGDFCPNTLLKTVQGFNPMMAVFIFYGSTEVLRSCAHHWKEGDPEGIVGTPLPSAQLYPRYRYTFQDGSTLCEEVWEGEKCLYSQPIFWVLADFLERDQKGMWYFKFRNADVLKVAGVRVSPLKIEAFFQAEIERAQSPIREVIAVNYLDDFAVVLSVSTQERLLEIEIALPRRYQPRYWIVLEEDFPLTSRQKRSRSWILQHALQYTSATTIPPCTLVTPDGST